MRIVVTGTTGGIGGALKAEALARGWSVTQINRADFEAGKLPLEGVYDAAVFATGFCPVRPAALTSDELMEEAFRVNCGYFHRLVREILEAKAWSPNGMRIVAVSSVSATEGWPGGAAYCASKGALSALCRALDAELKGKRISVQAVEPRYVKTRMFDACAGRMGVSSEQARDPAELAREILEGLEGEGL